MVSKSHVFDFAVIGESISGVLVALALRDRGASVVLMGISENAGIETLIDIPPTPITSAPLSGLDFVECARARLASAHLLPIADPNEYVQKVCLPAGGAEVAIENTRGDLIRASRVIYSPNGLESGLPWIPEVAELYGRGVSMCAWSDASYFAGKPVGIVGAGRRAAEQAILAHQAGAIPTIFCPFESFEPCGLEAHLAGRNVEILEAVSIEQVIADESGLCELSLVRNSGVGFKVSARGLFLAQGLVCDWELFGHRSALEPIHPRLIKVGLASGLPYWDLRAHIEQAERLVKELARV